MSAFIGFGTGKPLAAESSSPQSPGACPQGGNSPKGDTGPASPRAAQQSLEEGKESPKKTGETHGIAFWLHLIEVKTKDRNWSSEPFAF